MMPDAEMWGILLGSNLLSTTATAMVSRRPSMAKVFSDNYRDVITRLTQVEGRLDKVELELLEEKSAHGRTKDLLRTALLHIKEFTAWLAGPRHSEAPATPQELLKELC